jgi:hypothetical protein
LHSDGNLSHRSKPLVGDLLPYLGFRIVFKEKCSVRSFFRMLERYPELAKLNPFCPGFLNHFRSCPQQGCWIDGIDQLELLRTVDMVGYPGNPHMQIFVSLEGRFGKEVCDIKAYWLEQLLDLPLVLGHLKHRVFGDKMDAFDFETSFNLFELIDGICWQLSFHNLPEHCRIMI